MAAASVLALQNDMALRYGPACNFLAMRLKGLQHHQPELFKSGNQPQSSRRVAGNTVFEATNNVRSSVAASSAFGHSSGISSQTYHRSLSYNQEYSNVSSARHTPTRRSPSRVLRSSNERYGASAATTTATNNYNAAPDIDALPLPVPGQLSAEETLAKALSSDPTAQAPPKIKMAECKICHRTFDATRLDRHMVACQKSAAAAAKRKEFDVQEVRVKKLYENDPLTAEKVLQQIEKDEQLAASGRAPPKKSTWRKKSAELNNAVGRAGATGQPTPVEDDRVPCPGCGKKFAAETATRHIPSCVQRAKRNSFK